MNGIEINDLDFAYRKREPILQHVNNYPKTNTQPFKKYKQGKYKGVRQRYRQALSILP